MIKQVLIADDIYAAPLINLIIIITMENDGPREFDYGWKEIGDGGMEKLCSQITAEMEKEEKRECHLLLRKFDEIKFGMR